MRARWSRSLRGCPPPGGWVDWGFRASRADLAFLQGEKERRPDSGRRLEPDSAMVALDDLLGDRQSGAGAAAELVAAVQPLEDPEDGVLVLFGDADAVVA